MAIADMIDNNAELTKVIRRDFYIPPPVPVQIINPDQEGTLGLFGLFEGKKAAVIQDITSAIVLKYPFPPKDCESASTILEMLKNDYRAEQNRIASGGTSKGVQTNKQFLLGIVGLLAGRVSGKDIDNAIISGYEQQIKNFENYLTQAKCQQQLEAKANADFLQQGINLVNQQFGQDAGKNNTTTWIIGGVLGLILIGSLVILLKK
jgi:hypothetical protein